MITSISSLLLAMVSFQTGASFAKQLFPAVGAAGATTLRLCIAAILLLAVWRPWQGKITKKAASTIALYGASLGCMNLLFYQSIERIPLGIAVGLEFSGPLALAFVSSRKKLDFLWILMAACGIFFLVPKSNLSADIDLLGVIFALGAGFFWALYIIFGKKAANSMQTGKAISLGTLIAALVVLPVGLYQSGSNLLSPTILPVGLLVACLASVVPYSLEMISLKRLPAKNFGILMSLAPAIATLTGRFLLGETLSATQSMAIACIVLASLGSSLSFKKPTVNPLPISQTNS